MNTSDSALGAAGEHFHGIYSNGVMTLDTTSDKIFDCTMTFDTATVNNIITINEATLEYLN
jgi:hypothetical protein